MDNGKWGADARCSMFDVRTSRKPHYPLSIQYLPEVDSTNTYLASIADAVAPGHLVWTGHQRSGRGQRGTEWLAQPGLNLTFSFLLAPTQLPLASIFALTQCVALALPDAIASWTNGQINPDIKWPNDLLVNGKKLGGILIENRLQGERLATSIVGVGLNVNQTEFAGLEATSLRLETGQLFPDLAGFFTHLSAALGQYYPLLESASGRRQLSQTYHQHLCPQPGLWATYATDTETFEAKTLSVADSGHLWLERRNGARQAYEVKEVRLIDGKPLL